MQEGFLTLWEKRKQYLFTMMQREMVDRLGRQQKQAQLIPELEFQLSIEDRLIEDETQRDLRVALARAIQTLTPRQWEILFLRYYTQGILN